MTKLRKHTTQEEEMTELLIKNLPSKLKAGNEKELSNIFEYSSIKALQKCKFINFNTTERISFMIFDIDSFQDKTALEYFKDINGFFEHIAKNIGIEPTYILQTQKGFHFAYHLKNHVFTKQKKAVKYLNDIKKRITELLTCDKVASHRLKGIWRNPLKHPCYYSYQINYELSDFRYLLPEMNKINKHSTDIKVKNNDLKFIEGQRNKVLFTLGMRYAKNMNNLTEENIFDFISTYNKKQENCLKDDELLSISKSIFNYWEAGTIRYGGISKKKIVNEGIMNFEKINGLSEDEFKKEKKKRQTASAIRTITIRDKWKNKKQLIKAKKDFDKKRESKNKKAVLEAYRQMEETNKKPTYTVLAKICDLDRRTVKKYLLSIGS